MSATPKLTTYKFRVLSGTPEDPVEHHVASIGRDIQKVEQLFADRKWGGTDSRPMTAAAATAYFAMMRAGQYSGTWADFEEFYLAVEPEEPVTVTPTGPVPATG